MKIITKQLIVYWFQSITDLERMSTLENTYINVLNTSIAIKMMMHNFLRVLSFIL